LNAVSVCRRARWKAEQNKKVDIAGRVLLKVIEKDPEAVERALAS
jgi:hypothetical protein